MSQRKAKAPKSIVDRLRAEIESCGMSANELSRKSGVAVPIITRFLNEERTMTLDNAGKLCAVLGLELKPTH